MSNHFADYARIRMLWPDHLGLARGKYVPARLADRGSAFCVSTFGMSYDRDLIDAPHAYLTEGLKDIHGHIDIETIRPSWEDDRTGIGVAHLTLHDQPYEASSRVALQRSLAAGRIWACERRSESNSRDTYSSKTAAAAGFATPTRDPWSTEPARSVTLPDFSTTSCALPIAAGSVSNRPTSSSMSHSSSSRSNMTTPSAPSTTSSSSG